MADSCGSPAPTRRAGRAAVDPHSDAAAAASAIQNWIASAAVLRSFSVQRSTKARTTAMVCSGLLIEPTVWVEVGAVEALVVHLHPRSRLLLLNAGPLDPAVDERGSCCFAPELCISPSRPTFAHASWRGSADHLCSLKKACDPGISYQSTRLQRASKQPAWVLSAPDRNSKLKTQNSALCQRTRQNWHMNPPVLAPVE